MPKFKRLRGGGCTTKKGANGKITRNGVCQPKTRTRMSSTSRYGFSKAALFDELRSRGVKVRPGSKKSTYIKHWRKLNGFNNKTFGGGGRKKTNFRGSPVY